MFRVVHKMSYPTKKMKIHYVQSQSRGNIRTIQLPTTRESIGRSRTEGFEVIVLDMFSSAVIAVNDCVCNF